jgi:hypothetical protein
MAALGRPAVARESSIGSRTASVVSEELEGGAALRFSESAPEEGAKASETAAEGGLSDLDASSESDGAEESGDADDDEEDGESDGAEESDESDGALGAGADASVCNS